MLPQALDAWELPVVLMSGDPSPERVEEGILLGAAKFLSRPLQPAALTGLAAPLAEWRLRRLQQGQAPGLLSQPLKPTSQQESRKRTTTAAALVETSSLSGDEGTAAAQQARGCKKTRVAWRGELHEKFVVRPSQAPQTSPYTHSATACSGDG